MSNSWILVTFTKSSELNVFVNKFQLRQNKEKFVKFFKNSEKIQVILSKNSRVSVSISCHKSRIFSAGSAKITKIFKC